MGFRSELLDGHVNAFFYSCLEIVPKWNWSFYFFCGLGWVTWILHGEKGTGSEATEAVMTTGHSEASLHQFLESSRLCKESNAKKAKKKSLLSGVLKLPLVRTLDA